MRILSTSTRGLGVQAILGGRAPGGEAPHEPEGLGGHSPPNINLYCEFVLVPSSLGFLSTKSTISPHRSRILNDHIYKTINRQIDFSFVSEHCATLTKTKFGM